MHSLKIKLVATITLLIILLFSFSTWIFLREKTNELTLDIFTNARSYAQLTNKSIVSDYELFLPQQSFVYFNREIKGVFSKFQDLKAIQIVSYDGKILYDSLTENEKQYDGPDRIIEDVNLLNQIQSRNQSVKTLETNRVVYLQDTNELACGYLCVDENENPVLPLANDERIDYLVQPSSERYAVVYRLSYENLQQRIVDTITRGILLAVFGVGIGIVFAYMFASGITKPLKKLTLGAGIIAKGDFKHRVEITTKDELATLASAFNSMAQELDISTKALVYKERVAKELELAAKIQRELLPRVIPKITGMDISAGLLPAEEIGGDCYDFIKLSEDKLLMYLGDVTGHGVPAGIVVSIANALIYNYAGRVDLKELLVEVNRVMKEKTSESMFMTLVLLEWDAVLNKVRYVSAGHEQMIHFHANDGKITMTDTGGLALGMLPKIENVLEEKFVVMEDGDTLVIYSDGIPEAWKNETEMFGIGRLKRAISEYSDLPSAFSIRNALLAEVKEYTAGYKQLDDITVMVLKKMGGKMERADAVVEPITDVEPVSGNEEAQVAVNSESPVVQNDDMDLATG